MATTHRPYRIEVAGVRARTATTRRQAEVALGAMFGQVSPGAEGRIYRSGELVVVGVSELLGWQVRLEAGALVTIPQHGKRAQARIVGMTKFVAVVDVLEGLNAGRTLDAYLDHVEAVPMFETIGEFAFAVETAAGAELGRLFA